MTSLRAWLLEGRLGRAGRFAWLNLGWLELWLTMEEATLWLGSRRWIVRLRERPPTPRSHPAPDVSAPVSGIVRGRSGRRQVQPGVSAPHE